jgi:hypothetical protein
MRHPAAIADALSLDHLSSMIPDIRKAAKLTQDSLGDYLFVQTFCPQQQRCSGLTVCDSRHLYCTVAEEERRNRMIAAEKLKQAQKRANGGAQAGSMPATVVTAVFAAALLGF